MGYNMFYYSNLFLLLDLSGFYTKQRKSILSF